MTYDNELTGVLFANDKRETDKHPNARGSAQIDGVEYWVSAWTNVSKDGKKYQSLKFQRKEQTERRQESTSGGGSSDLDDSDLPF